MTIDMTVSDFVQSVTGYEELAAEKHFERRFGELVSDENSSIGGRALVFLHLMRTENDPTAVKKRVMEMPLRDVNGYFADEPDDVDLDPDQPDTELGKDAASSD